MALARVHWEFDCTQRESTTYTNRRGEWTLLVYTHWRTNVWHYEVKHHPKDGSASSGWHSSFEYANSPSAKSAAIRKYKLILTQRKKAREGAKR